MNTKLYAHSPLSQKVTKAARFGGKRPLNQATRPLEFGQRPRKRKIYFYA